MSWVAAERGSVDALRAAIGEWATTATGLAQQALAAAVAVLDACEAELRARSAQVAALEAMLRAADEEERPGIERALRDAEHARGCAQRAVELARSGVRDAQRVQRRVAEAAGTRAEQAMSSLARKGIALEEHVAVAVPAGGGLHVEEGATGGGGGGAGFGAWGLQDVDLGRVDFRDNPILDGFTRGGATMTDYRWAVETWETVVRPGVLGGKTRDDFAARDAEAGREVGFRRLAGVYDMFLGSDPIVLTQQPDGTYGVTSGRHRIEVARRLGIDRLPGRLDG